MKRSIIYSLLALHSVCVTPAYSLDLVGAWDLALQNDPTYQGARYNTEAEHENISIARSRLLPNVRFNGAISRNNTEQKYTNLDRPAVSYDYTAKREALSLSQPILRMDSYYQLKESESLAAAATQSLNTEFQTMAVRVATAYFDALLTRERYDTAKNRTEFFRSSLALAEISFKHGTGTRTDIEDAKSRLDSALADEIETRNAITDAEYILAAIIGQHQSVSDLKPIAAEKLTPAALTPATLQEWVELAQKNHPEIASLRHSLEAADREIDRNRAGHFPTVDLVASRSFSSSDSDNTIGNEYNTTSIGLQVAIPLYAGGGVNASIRQAVANREKSRYQLEAAQKKLEVNVSKEFSAVEHGTARIKALEQAVQSAQQAVTGNEKGVRAGTRHIVDILDAQQQLFARQTDLVEARHAYVMALLRLKAASGTISVTDINLANSWLSS